MTETHETEGEMSVLDHLRELRNRLLICVGAMSVFMLIGIRFVPNLMQILLRLGERNQYQFVYISPEELLMEYLTVDLVAALCLTLPVMLYELWSFLRPGLNQRERILILTAVLSGTVFAMLGILFAYKVLIPFMLRFLISLCGNSGILPSISVRNYISFILTLFLVFAAIFELPVAAVLLTQFGVLSVETMKRFRKAVVPLIFLVAAVITPPDVISQVIVAIPLLLLYELSILLCTWLDKIHERSGE